ncbi:hypothetical protein G9A89_023745 [Geosiphon pyriformis]|nr:hypothetical protein G9A89_023745 [Geosiphon pyriformis]
MSSTELCSEMGETIKLADKTASNLFSLCKILAIWSNTFLSECSRILTHKAKIVIIGIEPLTNLMPKLVSTNGVENKLLGELLITKAQVTLPKETR